MPDSQDLIGGYYAVDLSRPLPDAGGGIQAFTAIDRRANTQPLMALRVHRHAPARPRPLQLLTAGIEGLSTPLAHGPGPPVGGESAWYVVCQAPSGAPVSVIQRPWPETMLMEHVLRPIAAVLDQLQSRGLTHRAIRPNNVFQAQPSHDVTIGAAWAAPPAMHQPAVFETVYTALCHPAARGDGRIADDVYALGVLLVTLATGRMPMDGMDDKAIMSRKQELGDFAAVAGGERLPPTLTDLVRGMLAEDPDHRPSPALLRDPAASRGRRVSSRPPHHAQKPLKIGAMTVLNNRTLALAMALDPVEALAAIEGGTLTYWLRRSLGDSGLAVKLEELTRQRALDVSGDKDLANATLVMRAIMDADIFMPLCWRGLAIFPDGLGPVLDAAIGTARDGETDLHRELTEMLLAEAQGIWASMREELAPAPPQRLEARQRRAIVQIKGPAGGLPRLAYTLNPLTPCASPLLNGRWITHVRDIAPALDAVATASPAAELVEPHIAAFIGARSERRLDQEVKGLAANGQEADRALSALRLLSALQQQYHPAPLMGLTAWISPRARALVERWKNRERRAEIEEQLKSLTSLGFLAPILALLADSAGQAADSEGLRAARAEVSRLDAELRGIAGGAPRRAAQAGRMGQEIAAGLGLLAVTVTLILAALG